MHSIISKASILEIRYEPLYILALGAGLLSETAYEWVRRNLDSAFAKRREAEEQEEKSNEQKVLTDARQGGAPAA